MSANCRHAKDSIRIGVAKYDTCSFLFIITVYTQGRVNYSGSELFAEVRFNPIMSDHILWSRINTRKTPIVRIDMASRMSSVIDG